MRRLWLGCSLERNRSVFFIQEWRTGQALTPLPRSMEYLVARLKEKSTYSGILALLAAVGVAVDPEQFSAIAAAVMALVGVFEVFRRESK